MLAISGCSVPRVVSPVDAAEMQVAAGTPLDGDLRQSTAFPTAELEARRRLLLAVNALLTETGSPAEVRAVMQSIHGDSHLATGLRVEAGYLLQVVTMLEAARNNLAASRSSLEQCQKDLATYRAAAAEEIKGLQYKLKKLEEIYLETEKRRGYDDGTNKSS